jgi:hypothetical protein
MAIQLESYRNKFVAVAKQKVGSLLSTLPTQTGTTPAVLKVRKKNVQTQYPYIIVDYLGRAKQNGWISHRRVTEANDTQYETKYDLMFSYTVYGGDAVQIAEILEASFRSEVLRNSFRTEGFGAIVEVEDPVPVAFEDSGDFINTASFNILLSASDVEDIDEGIIDNFEFEGGVYRHADDEDPLEININVDFTS